MVTDALDFLLNARRTLLPLPVVDGGRRVRADVLPPFEPRRGAALQGKRVGIVGAAPGGAAVTLVGVARALEEAGVEPAAISACGGCVIWGAMWAGGLTSDEMLDYSLGWQPEDQLGIQWAGLPRFAFSALRGFTGLPTARALELLLDHRLWHMSAGETAIPLHTAAYDVEAGRVEYFGSEETPELTLGELVRIAVAPPLASEAVRVEGRLYVDGGAVDAFPAKPFFDGGCDEVFALELGQPPARGPKSPDLAGRLELARRSRERLGDRLTPIEPVRTGESRAPAFYELFLDRRRWPELIRAGYDAAVAALDRFSSRQGRGAA